MFRSYSQFKSFFWPHFFYLTFAKWPSIVYAYFRMLKMFYVWLGNLIIDCVGRKDIKKKRKRSWIIQTKTFQEQRLLCQIKICLANVHFYLKLPGEMCLHFISFNCTRITFWKLRMICGYSHLVSGGCCLFFFFSPSFSSQIPEAGGKVINHKAGWKR